MPKAKEPVTKHTMYLFEGDYEQLRIWYPEIGAGVIIRHLVRKYINNIRQGTAEQVDAEVEL